MEDSYPLQVQVVCNALHLQYTWRFVGNSPYVTRVHWVCV